MNYALVIVTLKRERVIKHVIEIRRNGGVQDRQ